MFCPVWRTTNVLSNIRNGNLIQQPTAAFIGHDFSLSPEMFSYAVIGIARIFSGGALFFLYKFDNHFLVVTLKTQAKSTKLTTPTVQISPIS